MTEEEHQVLCDKGNEFWHRFSDLCNEFIQAAPPHLREVYEAYLGDKTSIYGRRDTPR